jgi:hypothetical protein
MVRRSSPQQIFGVRLIPYPAQTVLFRIDRRYGWSLWDSSLEGILAETADR